MTAAFLRPAIRAHPEVAQYLPEWLSRIQIGVDPTSLVARPNRGASATEGFTIGALSWAAWRKHNAFAESDAPTDEELDKRAVYGFTRPKNPNATATAVTDAGGSATPSTGPARLSGVPSLQAAALPTRSTDLGSRFAQIEGRLRERLIAASSAALADALRKAGNRLRTKAQADETLRAAVNGLPADQVPRTIGLQAAATLTNPDELLDGAFDELHGTFDRYTGRAQASVVKALAPYATDPEAAQALADYQAQTDRRRDLGWAMLVAALLALGRERMFTQETTGEAASDVPMGIIRSALTVVGGLDSSNVPTITGYAGGLTGGSEVGGVLDQSSLTTEGWQWIHGDPPTPFEPHLDLDGLVFTDWQDDALANNEDYPPYPYFWEGDHTGCQCVTIPAIVTTGEPAGEVPSEPNIEVAS
jgi:hypothetical protein